MNPEERSLLERTYKMTEENNEILKSLRRTSRLGIVMKIFYWVVIIGTTLGAFYFIRPYMDFLANGLGVTSDVGTTDVSLINSKSENIQSLLELLTTPR
jgi:hypothetical protein